MKIRKLIGVAIMAATMATGVVGACPKWECQYPIDYYGCGCSGCGYIYDETSTYNQPIYCQYCGNEAWDCVCNASEETAGDCYISNSYCYGGSTYMGHWANIRDCYGNIIGQAGEGDSIEIIGDDCNDCSRVIIYDYCNGVQGSVLRECVYGTYSWDGAGDNGIYNSYQEGSWDGVYDSYDSYDSYDCSSDYGNGCSGGGYISTGCTGTTYVSYSELINIYRQYVAMTGNVCIPTCR